MADFEQRLQICAADIEVALARHLTVETLSGPGPAPERLVAAMRHGALDGGKRLRPFLGRETAALFGVPAAATIEAGVAIEMVHCYSLIHDDLPAMDDDDLRRGRPTVHKVFGEATAILAGDALLTHAFGVLVDPSAHPDPAIRGRLVAELAAGAGVGGMAGGQQRDIDGEGNALSESEISTLQAMKTGALIRAAVRMGAILGDADVGALDRLTRFAEIAGRAFQLADDLLDATADASQLGKAAHKDEAAGKPTLVARVGIEAARERLAALVGEGVSALSAFGPEADGLRDAIRYFASRDH